MNGVVFQISAMMITASELMWPAEPVFFVGDQRQVVDKSRFIGEGELPGEGGDHGDDPVGDQDDGADDPAAEDRPGA